MTKCASRRWPTPLGRTHAPARLRPPQHCAHTHAHQPQVIVLLFAAYSLPFELVAKACLCASALLFVWSPFPAARIVAIFSVVALLGLARLRRLTTPAAHPDAPLEAPDAQRREHAE